MLPNFTADKKIKSRTPTIFFARVGLAINCLVCLILLQVMAECFAGGEVGEPCHPV